MTDSVVAKSIDIQNENDLTEEIKDIINNITGLIRKVKKFKKTPIATRYDNIGKFIEILTILNKEMINLIMYDNDLIYYDLIPDIVEGINFYKKNTDIYHDKDKDMFLKLEEKLNISTGMILLYIEHNRENTETK